MDKYRQIIHIDGRCIEDILRLQCVKSVEKTTANGVYKFYFYAFHMAHPSQFQNAYTGDVLAEDYDGKWHVLRGEENTEI